MKNDCLFCKIINNELPSSTVYEDNLIKIIMNINPNTNGHLLILPKKHYVNILDIDEEIKFKLDDLSKKRGMKTNELIRFILSEYLLKEGKK